MANLNATSHLDQSGSSFQKMRVHPGPSIGWVDVFAQPSQVITSIGTVTLTTASGIVFVNVAGAVTINLPKASLWLNEQPFTPANAFERAIWIKDLGGNAAASNITIHPFSGDAIDLLAQDFTIVQNRQLLRLYPLNDLTGWFSG